MDFSDAHTILCIQPHYDDNDIGAGGVLASLCAASIAVDYLTVTDDLVGLLDPSLPDQEARRLLAEEQDQAGKIIGVRQQYWLNYPDAGPIDYYALRKDIVTYIRRLRPDYIFTVDPWLPYEAHQDHILTGRAVAEAAILYQFPRFKTLPEIDSQYKFHELKGVAFYFTHAPNIFYDISYRVETQNRALLKYRLQFTDADLTALIEDVGKIQRHWAIGRGFSHAGALKVLSPIELHIHPHIM